MFIFFKSVCYSKFIKTIDVYFEFNINKRYLVIWHEGILRDYGAD